MLKKLSSFTAIIALLHHLPAALLYTTWMCLQWNYSVSKRGGVVRNKHVCISTTSAFNRRIFISKEQLCHQSRWGNSRSDQESSDAHAARSQLPATHFPVLETICMSCHFADRFKIMKSESGICMQACFTDAHVWGLPLEAEAWLEAARSHFTRHLIKTQILTIIIRLLSDDGECSDFLTFFRLSEKQLELFPVATQRGGKFPLYTF